MDQFEGLTADAVKRKITAHRGHRTRAAKQLQQILQLAKDSPSDMVRRDLLDTVDDLRVQVKALSSAYDYLISIDNDPENVRQCEANAAKVDDEFTQLYALVTAAMKDRAPAAPLAQAPPVQDGVVALAPLKVKPRDSLRPPLLSRQLSPAEFRSWAKAYKSFHGASNFHLLPMEQQQAYLLSTLDFDLKARLENSCQEDTPIFEAPAVDDGEDAIETCMDILKREFLRTYPLHSRRNAVIDARQVPGQLMTDLIDVIEKAGAEADLHVLTTDELYCLIIVNACTDDRLKRKLQAKSRPTVKELKEICVSYERIEATNAQSALLKASMVRIAPPQKGLPAPKSGARGQSGQGGQSSRSGPPKSGTGQRTLPSKDFYKLSQEKKQQYLANRCAGCGSKEHRKPQCPAVPGKVCFRCEQAGHLANVCMMSAAAVPPRARQVEAVYAPALEYHDQSRFEEVKDDDVVQANMVRPAFSAPATPKVNL